LAEEDSLDADLLYLTAGAFARVLLSRLDEPDREVDAAFALIERLHLEGDTYVTELATIGFLESIQQPEDAAVMASCEHRLGPEWTLVEGAPRILGRSSPRRSCH